jgi:hypothetical protein
VQGEENSRGMGEVGRAGSEAREARAGHAGSTAILIF